MKIFCCALLTLLLSSSAFADTWDCMTKEEAQAVQTLLEEKMTYMLDYCDCCEADASLVRVREVNIVPCEYDDDMYSVKVTGALVAAMPFTGAAFEEVIPADEELADYVFEELVSLNYSFGMDANGAAKTIASLIEAETWNGEPCQDEIAYPKPSAVEDESYTAWFQKVGLK